MEEIITFPVWSISFPVLKTNFESLGKYGEDIVKEFFDQRPGSGRNNSISCFENQF